MSVGLVVLGLVAVGVVVAAAVIAVLYFRFGMFRRRKGRKGGKSGILGESRIEVLERTKVDAERQLVLVRCDGIEHLILVGGPSDVVVENDVKKVRGPGAPAPKVAAAATPFEAASLAPARSSPPPVRTTATAGKTLTAAPRPAGPTPADA
ncbi:MAG: flagellar biosynthetic protein FliO, partial [Propylenella sp.]